MRGRCEEVAGGGECRIEGVGRWEVEEVDKYL